ncbi:unnamed protein product [Calypogeia fissa]
MWSTIANFKDNLSQIVSDVLDTADELKRGGSQDDYDDKLFDDSPATSHRSSYKEKEADLKADVPTTLPLCYEGLVPLTISSMEAQVTNHFCQEGLISLRLQSDTYP